MLKWNLSVSPANADDSCFLLHRSGLAARRQGDMPGRRGLQGSALYAERNMAIIAK